LKSPAPPLVLNVPLFSVSVPISDAASADDSPERFRCLRTAAPGRGQHVGTERNAVVY